MDQERTDATGRSVPQDLAFLALRGLSETSLAQCQTLLALVMQELGEATRLSLGARVALLRKVLLGVIAEKREEAAAHLDEFTLRQAAEQPMFQVAAAGELLRLTDQVVFARVSAHRIRKWTHVRAWSDLEGKIKPGDELAMARLRASTWLGSSHPRTVMPDRREPEVLAALENALPSYVHDNRDELIAGFDGLAAAEETAGPPGQTDSDQTASPGVRTLRRKTMTRQQGGLLAAACLLVVIGIVVVVALLDGRPSGLDNPATAPSSSQVTPSMRERLENAVARCLPLPPDSQLAKELRDKRQAVTDGRCDNSPERPVGAYADATRASASRGLLPTGQVIEDICLVEGQRTQDAEEHWTTVWVRYTAADGKPAFVSAIWVQGEEGVQAC